MTRAEEIARALIRQSEKGYRRTTISELARRYGVGMRTVSTALRIARKKARIYTRKGVGIIIGGNAPPDTVPLLSQGSAYRLARRLEHDIAKGVLHLSWLAYLGVDVPRQLSHVSFDNSELLSVQQMSTIDFGLADLGERAAHLFIRDIPVATDDRQGNMSSRPELINRGSLGPPRKGMLNLG